MNRIAARTTILLAFTLLLSSCSARKLGQIDVNSMPIRSNVPAEGDPSACEGKPKCIVLYSAPWCRKTKQSRDFINALQQHLRTDPTFGLMLIFGNDEPQKIFACQADFPGLHYYDPGDTAAEILAIDTIPDVLVFDRQGNLLYRDAGLPRKPDQRTILEFLAELSE